jgi:hypothetical protein
MTEERPSVESLLDKIIDSTRNVVHYMRQRFLWTWFAIGLLAILTSFALILATRTAETNLKQTDDIAKIANTTADSAKAQSDQTTAYLKGEQGIPGVPGANGVDGTPGQPSSVAGPPGPAGPKGSDGSAGSTGPPGSTGSAGPMGPTGAFGAIGPVGPTGATGEAGPAGEKGATGVPGATGAQGDTGTQGNKGDTGAQGPKGDVGPQGPAGPVGPQGPVGAAPTITTATVAASSPNDASPQKNVTATCATGKVTGGGYAILPATSEIVPTTSSTNGNGWQVTANASSSFTGTWQVLALATCTTIG